MKNRAFKLVLQNIDSVVLFDAEDSKHIRCGTGVLDLNCIC